MSLKRKADGTYEARWYADGTKASAYMRRNLGAVTKKEAERQYKTILAAAVATKEKRNVVAETITFSELAAQYLEFQGPKMSEKGQQRAKGIVKLLNAALGSKRVADLEPLDVERYQQERVAKVSPATVNREWQVLRAILNWGEKKKRVPNPIRSAIDPYKLENRGAKVLFFEAEEWQRFIAAFESEAAWREYVGRNRKDGPIIGNVRSHSPRGRKGVVYTFAPRRFGGGRRPDSVATGERLTQLRAFVPIFQTLLYTGARLGDVVALEWRQIDFRRGIVTIEQSKTKKAIPVPMSDVLREVLTALPKGIGEARVFTRPDDGRPFRTDEVQRAFAIARDVSGIRKALTPHTLRHTFGSWLAIKGIPIYSISTLLGHSSIEITARHYAHLQPKDTKGAADHVGEMGRRQPQGNLKAGSDEGGSA